MAVRGENVCRVSKASYRLIIELSFDAEQSNTIMEFKVAQIVIRLCLQRPFDTARTNRKIDISFDNSTDCLIQALRYQE